LAINDSPVNCPILHDVHRIEYMTKFFKEISCEIIHLLNNIARFIVRNSIMNTANYLKKLSKLMS
ncbi:hypothetical protein, partial [Xenorhabdus bovienii]